MTLLRLWPVILPQESCSEEQAAFSAAWLSSSRLMYFFAEDVMPATKSPAFDNARSSHNDGSVTFAGNISMLPARSARELATFLSVSNA